MERQWYFPTRVKAAFHLRGYVYRSVFPPSIEVKLQNFQVRKTVSSKQKNK